MLQMLGTYIKVAADIRRGILAGGGAMHADAESVLLEDGSLQSDLWGADWIPDQQQIEYESFINIRPRDGNRTMELRDANLRQEVSRVVMVLLGGVEHE
jgi:hypothetical protein